MPHERGYDPSPSEIAAVCREIQKGWTERERKVRSGIDPRRFRWFPPGVLRTCRGARQSGTLIRERAIDY
jgi:hypothetical protein